MMVVDLTVEHNPHGPIFIAHRLRATGAIDDREPTMAERGTGAVCNALSIWTTVAERCSHGGKRFANCRIKRTFESDNAADATHEDACLAPQRVSICRQITVHHRVQAEVLFHAESGGLTHFRHA